MGISEKFKKDTAAFRDGYKPAILSDRDVPYVDLMQKYPYVRPFVSQEPDSTIYFQTQAEKDLYLKRIKHAEEGTPEFEYIIGTTLGFPKRSAKWFADMVQKEQELGDSPPEKDMYDVGIYWAGFSFVSHIDFVDTEIEWMWNTYDHPKAKEHSLFLLCFETGFHEISFGDLKYVRNIQESIKRERGLLDVAIAK